MNSRVNNSFPVVGNTAVDEFILSTLVTFIGLVANLFFSIDKAILVSVVIEVNFPISVVNLDQFLPIVVLFR